MSIVLIFAVVIVGMLISVKYGPSLPRPYRFRGCEGRGWRRTFPTASKDEIRSFLLLFVSAFAFADKDKLKFRPDDKILDVYRSLYRPAANHREKDMMNNKKTANAWQAKILVDCEHILQRQLTDVETRFVRSREGFIALEMIEDSVSQMSAMELTAYLNSDHFD